MNQKTYSTMMSRRRVMSLVGAAAGTGVAVAATLRSASAQTSGMERRDERRDDRGERRDDRQQDRSDRRNPTQSQNPQPSSSTPAPPKQ